MFSLDSMALNHQPLKLYDLATFQVVIASAAPSTKSNIDITSEIKKLPCKAEILTDILHVRDQCLSQLRYMSDDIVNVILLFYMQNLLESIIFYTHNLQNETDDEKRLKMLEKRNFCDLKIRHFIPFVYVEPVINEIFQLFEIDQDLLLFILDHVKEFTVLNNFMIIGGFYGFKAVIEMAALKGADDFESATKAACLRKDEEMVRFLAELNGSDNISIYSKTSEYRVYYMSIRGEAYSSNYKQFLAGEYLKKALEDNYPFEKSGLSDWVEDLDTPIAKWSKFNLFRNVAVINSFDVGGFVHTQHNK